MFSGNNHFQNHGLKKQDYLSKLEIITYSETVFSGFSAHQVFQPASKATFRLEIEASTEVFLWKGQDHSVNVGKCVCEKKLC